MIDLKPYFDAVNAAEAEVQRIANEIDTLFREETGDGGAIKVLELKPVLDEAQKKHEEAVAMYEAMQRVNRPNDVARNFVPVSSTQVAEVGDQPTVIKRQAYDAMSLVERAKFIRSGGTLED
jgi:uncharacterized protein (UPF0335 family)